MTRLYEEVDSVAKDLAEAGYRIEITGVLDRHEVEVLQLQIRRLAKRFGV